MSGPHLLVAALALALMPRAGMAQLTDPPPPPGTRSLCLLDVPFLHFGPMESAPDPARALLDVRIAYANTFSHTWHPNAIHGEFGLRGAPFSRVEAETLHVRHPQDTIAFLDGEVTRIALRGAWGLTDHISVSLELPVVLWSALHLDRAIEDFHSSVGLRDAQREDFPRARFQIVRQRPYGPLEYDDRTPASGLGDATASLGWRTRLPDGTGLGADLALKLPTGSADDYRGSGSVDVGLLVGAQRRFGSTGRWGVRLEAAVLRPGPFLGDVPTTFDVSPFLRLMAAAQVRLGKGTWVSVTGVLEQSPFRHDAVGDGARTGGELTLGLTRRVSKASAAELALTENLPRYGDAADIAVTLGFRTAP